MMTNEEDPKSPNETGSGSGGATISGLDQQAGRADVSHARVSVTVKPEDDSDGSMGATLRVEEDQIPLLDDDSRSGERRRRNAQEREPQRLKTTAFSVGKGALATFFIFMSDVLHIKELFAGLGKLVVLPLLALAEVMHVIAAGYALAKAKNRHSGKIFDLVFSVVSAGIIITAIVGSFLGFSPLLVLALFLGAIGANAAYNIGQCFHHVYLWAKTPADNEQARAFFRGKILNHLMHSVVASVMLAGLVVVTMLPFVGPIVLAACGITTAVVIVASLVYELYKYARAECQSGPSLAPYWPTGVQHGFYKREGYDETMRNAMNNAPQEADHTEDQHYRVRLLAGVEALIDKNKQLSENIQSQADDACLFSRCFQGSKRTNKLSFLWDERHSLERVQQHLLEKNHTIYSQQEILAEISTVRTEIQGIYAEACKKKSIFSSKLRPVSRTEEYHHAIVTCLSEQNRSPSPSSSRI